MNLFDVLKDINRQIDEQVEVLVWQKEAHSFNQSTAIKMIITGTILLILLFFINLTYAVSGLILSLVLLPTLIYSACSPTLFWHYNKKNNTLYLYKKKRIIKEISCDNLALSIRIGANKIGARWVLVSPSIGDMEILFIAESLLLYGKNLHFFYETTNRLAQYTQLRRTVDTF